MSNSEKANKWIPISKEVPKEKGEYITTTMYGEVFCDYWNGDAFDRTETVIAWQKKPSPYRAESDILDKIKTEIEQRCCITVGEGEPAMTLYDIFQIIDKYKKESEG